MEHPLGGAGLSGTITIRLQRGEPGDIRQQEFRVPWHPQMTVLEALDYVYTYLDASLAFNYGCRSKTCGVCTLRMAGRAGLSCETFVVDGMVVEPYDPGRIIRDLATDQRLHHRAQPQAERVDLSD